MSGLHISDVGQNYKKGYITQDTCEQGFHQCVNMRHKLSHKLLPIGFKQLCLNSSHKFGGVNSAVDDSAVGFGGACHHSSNMHCRI